MWQIIAWRAKGKIAEVPASAKIIEAFKGYSSEVMDAVGSVPYLITTNEPSVFIANGYLKGDWPPQRRFKPNPIPTGSVIMNLVKAHNGVYDMVKKASPETQISATEAIRGFSPANFTAIVEARVREQLFNTLFFRLSKNDFYGVNYFRNYPLRRGSNYLPVPEGLDTDIETYNAPFAFEDAVRMFARTLPRKPIFVTESGTRSNGAYQGEFIQAHLARIQRLRRAGLRLVGYMPWALTDTYEWFEPLGDCRMGLAEVDFETGERTPREAFYVYQKVIDKYHLTKNF